MAKKRGRGNVQALAKHVGKVGFTQCKSEMMASGHSAERPTKICGKAKGMAKRMEVLSPEHAFGRKKKGK